MAEIKSAIELAMEKTRDLVVDSRERAAMAAKEVEDRIRAVLRRLMENMIDCDAAVRELGKIDADRVVKRDILVDSLVDGLDLRKSNDLLLSLFRSAGISPPESLLNELAELTEAFREEVKTREMILGQRIREELVGSGVAGTGFDINLPAWNEWHEEMEQVGKVFDARLEELKNRLKAASKQT